MRTITTKVKKINSQCELPLNKDPGDAGCDLFVRKVEDYGNYIKVYTGVAIQPTKGYYYMLVPRSSIYKKGLELYNGIGIIDNNFTGEIVGIFYKTKDFKELPKEGERLLQLVPQEQFQVEFIEVEELSNTERGEGGFGSSGN